MPTTLDIGVVRVDNVNVIRVYVEGNDTPYSAYGRYYTRIDDGDIPMSNNQLQNFFESKEDNYLKREEKPSSCTYDDIDEDLVIKVIRLANERGRLNYIYEDLDKALTKLDLITDDGKIKIAGCYLFSKKKPLLIKEANYPTDTRNEFGEIKEFRDNIFECIEEAESYIRNHITYKSDIIGLERRETPEIPIKAIREIVNNSFAHSKYSIKGDYIQFIIFKSTVKIYNPGSIYKDVDPMRFAKGEVGSKIRNVLIASVLYKCGYIDEFGTGFDRTFTLCNKYNVKYEYKNDEFGFTFIFYRKPQFISFNKNNILSIIDEKILTEIRMNKYITIPELANKMNKSEATVYRYLKRLIDSNVLKRIGSRKIGHWEINESEF